MIEKRERGIIQALDSPFQDTATWEATISNPDYLTIDENWKVNSTKGYVTRAENIGRKLTKKRGFQRIQVLRKLLENPEGKLTKYRLAKLSNCTNPTTLGILKKLEEKNIVSGTKVRLPEELISLWKEWRIDPEIRSYDIDEPLKVIKNVKLEYALTNEAAENLMQNSLETEKVDFYINPEDKEEWNKLLSKNGTPRQDKQGNTRILIGDENILTGKRDINGYTVVSKPQLIIDLISEGEKYNKMELSNEVKLLTSQLTDDVEKQRRSELTKPIELPRGMRDFESDEMAKINLIREKFQETAQLFGFKQMDPSPIDLFSTLEAKGGPSIRKEIYSFKDKGKREIALRFDFTVGLTRYVVSQKSLRLPAKFSAFGGVWRYDEPQKGRYRFFNQWNVETYGKPSIETEAEIIEFTSRLFDNLKLQNIVIDFNNRNLVQSYINKIFDSNDPQLVGDILRAVDKIQKKRKEEILVEYMKQGYDQDKLEKILEFAQIKGTPEEIESTFDVSELDSWDKLKQLWNSLKNRNVNNIRINFGIVRGLDYYSGMVFEVFDTTSDLGALAGGGTYDALTKAFGRDDIGATGVAGGVERIILTMEKQRIIDIKPEPRISVVYINDKEMQDNAYQITSVLRQKGIGVDVDLLGRSMKKQMEIASDSKYAIIVGPKEFAENKVVLRNMQDRTEKQISINELLSDPKSIFSSNKKLIGMEAIVTMNACVNCDEEMINGLVLKKYSKFQVKGTCPTCRNKMFRIEKA